MSSEIDDRTVAYVIEAQPVFEDLRQVAAQLAGMLVLHATGAKTATPDHPLLTTASQLFAQATDVVERVRPLVSERARRHHDELAHAAAALGDALAAARIELGKPGVTADLDAALAPLRRAYDSLQRAAAALPGFQMVSFDQACCSTAKPASAKR